MASKDRLEQMLAAGECPHALGDSAWCPDCIAEIHAAFRIARGAIAAQDEREAQAGERCGVPREEHGCDWPDAMAEALLTARAAQQQAEQERDADRLGWAQEFMRLADEKAAAERQLAALREAVQERLDYFRDCRDAPMKGKRVEIEMIRKTLNVVVKGLEAELRAAPQGDGK